MTMTKSQQILVYMVIDKSASMNKNGLENQVKKGIENVKRFFNTCKEFGDSQMAVTLFGSTLEMHPFQSSECVELTSYETSETETKLYDAVAESCKKMIRQYDELKSVKNVKGFMFILTDGEEKDSINYCCCEMVRNYLDELASRDIIYLLATYKGVNLDWLCRAFRTTTISIDDAHEVLKLFDFINDTIPIGF